jgi:hypothetical protein
MNGPLLAELAREIYFSAGADAQRELPSSIYNPANYDFTI